MAYHPTRKFKVRATRLVEQECEFYFDAPKGASDEEIVDLAADMAEQITEGIWVRTLEAPHSHSVEELIPAEQLSKHRSEMNA